MAAQPDFPTLDQVEKANKEQLAKWYRFFLGTTPEQRETLRRVAKPSLHRYRPEPGC